MSAVRDYFWALFVSSFSLTCASCSTPPTYTGVPEETCPDGVCQGSGLCNVPADCPGVCNRCENNLCHKYADFCVLGVEPFDGAQNVPLTTQLITVRFSAPLSAEDASAAVSLKRGQNESVPLSVEVLDDKLSIKTNNLLKSGSTYQLTINELLRSRSYIPLSEPFVSSFTTVFAQNARGSSDYVLTPMGGRFENTAGDIAVEVVEGAGTGILEGSNGLTVTITNSTWN